MKKLTHIIYSLSFALTLFVTGVFAAPDALAAGGQFDPNPANSSTQFVSIKAGNACSGCANQQNSVSVGIPNPGDTSRFTVYMDFRNKGTATIYNAKGKITLPNSGGTITGTLSGQGAPSISDTAFLTNLPSSYEINFVAGYVENTHGTTDPTACAGYNKYYSITGSQVLGSGAPIGDLDTVYNGWCDQGYVIATFEIKNTGQTTPTLQIQTNEASNVTTNSARLNGQVVSGNNASVWFAFSSNSNTSCTNQSQQVSVGGTYGSGQSFFAGKSGLQSSTTYYFRACGKTGINGPTVSGQERSFVTTNQTPNLQIQTNNATNVNTNSARLNGQVVTGTNANVWFAFGTNSNPSCNGQTVPVGGAYSSGQNFSAVKSGLQPNTTYYFKACGQQGSQTAEGSVRSFVTTNQTPNLQIQTNNATSVSTNSAVLNGRVITGSNVNVWFAFSSNSNTSCTNQSQQVSVGGTYSTGQNFSATKSGLQPNTTYYFRACGQAGSSIEAVVSGSELSFTTQSTTGQYTYDWQIGNWGTCVNGQQSRSVVCKRFPGNLTVNDSFCPPPKPATQQSCSGGNPLAVETLGATDIGPRYATLNGRVTNGTTNYVYFVYDYEYNSLNCANSSSNVRFAANHTQTRTAGDMFSYTFPHLATGELQPNTTYHYRACASTGGVIDATVAQGQNVIFRTTSDGGTVSSPQAETRDARDIREDSAELNGQIRMNDYQDGTVFFVYGRDRNRVENTQSNYMTYNDVRNNESRDNYMTERVDTNNSTSGWKSYSTRVRSLLVDERYYFEICVEFRETNGNSKLTCGNARDFRTARDGGSTGTRLEIRTDNPRSVTQTTAEMCGTLVNDGGSRRRTYLEFRENNGGFFTSTPERQRGEGQFCERVSGLLPSTVYSYRACADGSCASERTFRTIGDVVQGLAPTVITQEARDIRSNYALLRGTYLSNADRATIWFNYGRTQGLGSETRRQNVTGAYGEFSHPFTNLAPNTTYYYQAAIQTVNGFAVGGIYSFRTSGSGVVISTPPPVVIVQENTGTIDLSSLGLGLSLIRLNIDDQEEVIVRDEQLTYVVEWENISQIDLFKLELKVSFPEEIQVVNVSRGRFDQKTNTLYYTIESLRAGERDSLSISAIVGRGTIGSLITAEAEIAYNNPVNEAKENAKDFDVDEYGARFAGVTASVFGLGNITFLGWLVILLGLFIIFLIARWLYLEREEMRAQAYASGYRPYIPAPGYNAYGQAQGQIPPYQEAPRYDVPPAGGAAAPEDFYEPYRPNRGE